VNGRNGGNKCNGDVTTVTRYRLPLVGQSVMTTRRVLLIGSIGGFVVPAIALALLSSGLPSDFMAGDLNLTRLLWPSYVMLVVGWRSTIPGMMITILSVVTNCLLYMALAYIIRRIVGLVHR
jgi:hypothetical protein